MKKTILIIDDDPYFADMLCEMLHKEGFEVLTAGNGIEGTDIVNQKGVNIDLVLTDIIMPDKEGIETIIDLKKHHPGIKIIAMSGGGRIQPHSYLECAKALGAEYTLEKPFLRKELCDAIDNLLTKS